MSLTPVASVTRLQAIITDHKLPFDVNDLIETTDISPNVGDVIISYCVENKTSPQVLVDMYDSAMSVALDHKNIVNSDALLARFRRVIDNLNAAVDERANKAVVG